MKFRCSSLGKLMTEPRSKSEGVLSVGAKTYIRELGLSPLARTGVQMKPDDDGDDDPAMM